MRRTNKTSVAWACAFTVLALAALAPAAGAATRWSLRGAGFGHGVGMSQYGAFGYARHGYGYRDILQHYYTGARLERRGASIVRVLLQGNRSTVRFTGATAAGSRQLKPTSVYRATRSGRNVVLRSPSGRPLEAFVDVIPVVGASTFRLLGSAGNGVTNGFYRGSLEIRVATTSGLNAINTLPMEDYLQGVVPAESPPIWPAAALQAQAVAARSYALATNVGGRGFEQYPDTRSQMYRGFNAEKATSNSAVDATRGEVLTYGGNIIVTYFFSTSGGQTENVENVFFGSGPKPWLRGVSDPYDDASPYHRWGPYSYTTRRLDSALGGYVRGKFRRLKVLSRGTSPRVVRAQVQGSGGNVAVTGPQLRSRLGLRDTWFSLRRVSTNTGASQARIASGVRRLSVLAGEVDPPNVRFVKLQRRQRGSWHMIANVPVFRHGEVGAYSFHVARGGIYRVVAGWAPGPRVDVGGR